MAWRPAPAVRNPLLALRRVVEAPDLELLPGGAEGLEPVPGGSGALAVAERTDLRAGVDHEHVELHHRSEPVELHARPVPPEHKPPSGRPRSRGRRERTQPIPERPVRALITSTPVAAPPTEATEGRPSPDPAASWATQVRRALDPADTDAEARPGADTSAPESAEGHPSPDASALGPAEGHPSPDASAPESAEGPPGSAPDGGAGAGAGDPAAERQSPAHAAAGPWSTWPDAPPSTPTLLRLGGHSLAAGATGTATGRTATVIKGVPAVTARDAAVADAPTAPARPSTRRDPTPVRPATRPALAPTTESPAARVTPGFAPEATARPAPGLLLGPATQPLTAPPSAYLASLAEPAVPTEPTGRRPMTVFQVAVTMVAALCLWALVDAPALLHGAETAPRGARRDASLAVLRPLDRVSAALGLDRVTHVVDDLLGRHSAAPPAVPPRTPRASGHRSGPLTAPSVSAPALLTPPTTVSRLAPLRVGTAANPLRVLVVGDSLGLDFGYSMENKLDAGGIVHTTVDGRVATGLTRPDSFDWSAELQSDLAQFRPEVVVAMFGGNDDQDAIVGGRFIPFGSQAWGEIYGSRVASFADAVHAHGARLLWAGLPVMRSAAKTQRLQTVMAVTRAVLAGRDGAAFVDETSTLADGSGHYAVALPDGSGQLVIVREPDGVHFSPAGADRLADRAIGTMEGSWHLIVRPAAPSRHA